MTKLGEHDRSAVVLRFFENKTLAEVGVALGLSEDAARQRVNRALEKLRKLFAKNGVNSTAVAITGALSVNAIQVAPAALSKTVIVVALSKGAAASASTLTLINGALKIMAWTKAKTAIVLSACVLVTASATTSVILFSRPKPPQGIPAGWSVIRGSPDQWSWSDGVVRGRSIEGDSLLMSTQAYQDVTISAMVSTTNREASVGFRFQDADNGYVVVFTPAGIPNWPAHIGLLKRVAGEEVGLGNYQGHVFSSLGQTAKIEVLAQGQWMQVRLNDVVVLRAKDTSFSSGFIGLRIYGDPGSPCDATYSNLTFR